MVTSATGRALATSGPCGLNVVPVSAAHIVSDTIRLYDFFMNKTVVNIKQNPQVALSCWDGLAGVQIKAKAEYVTDGADFAQANTWAKEAYPERVLRGVIILQPTECYSISPLAQPGAALALHDE